MGETLRSGGGGGGVQPNERVRVVRNCKSAIHSSAAPAKLELTKNSLRERKLITGDLVAPFPGVERAKKKVSRANFRGIVARFVRLIITRRQQRPIVIAISSSAAGSAALQEFLLCARPRITRIDQTGQLRLLI